MKEKQDNFREALPDPTDPLSIVVPHCLLSYQPLRLVLSTKKYRWFIKKSRVVNGGKDHMSSCIPVRGQINKTARMDNLVIPKRTGWITSYPPVVRVDN